MLVNISLISLNRTLHVRVICIRALYTYVNAKILNLHILLSEQVARHIIGTGTYIPSARVG
jgi:hypothetical protein